MAQRWMLQKTMTGRKHGFEPAQRDVETSWNVPEGKRAFRPAETPASRKAKAARAALAYVPLKREPVARVAPLTETGLTRDMFAPAGERTLLRRINGKLVKVT